MPQIKGKQLADNSITLAKLDSSITANFPAAGSSSQVYYVSKGGDDGTGDGSVAKPFLTIGAAHTQALADFPAAGGAQVSIVVDPGTYTENLSITRPRTLFVCDDRDSRVRSVTVVGKVTIAPSAVVGTVLEDVIAFDGFNIQNDDVTDPAVSVSGTNTLTVILNNCHIVSSVAGVKVLDVVNTSTTRPLIRLRFSVLEGNECRPIYANNGILFVNHCTVRQTQATLSSYETVLLTAQDASRYATLSGTGSTFQATSTAGTLRATAAIPLAVGETTFNLSNSTIINSLDDALAKVVDMGDTNSAAFFFCTFSKSNSSAKYFALSAGTSTVTTANCAFLGIVGTSADFADTGVTNLIGSSEAVSGDVSGRFPSMTVTGLQGSPVNSATPVAFEALVYDGLASEWKPSLITQDSLDLVDPTSALQAATKQYVDNLVNGISWKAPVRAVATTEIASLTDVATIDTVSLVDGDRVLLTSQTTTPKDNGIWIVKAGVGVPWERPADFDSTVNPANAAVFVKEGSVANADTSWVCTSQSATIDTDPLAFVQFGSGSTTYTAGDGLQLDLSGTEFSVKADGDTVSVGGDGVRANSLASGTLEATPLATTGDQQPTGVTLASAPTGAGIVHVFVNGVRVSVGDGVTTKDCYFALTGTPGTAINFADLGIGDELHWNGTIAGYDLEVTDAISLLFLDTTS